MIILCGDFRDMNHVADFKKCCPANASLEEMSSMEPFWYGFLEEKLILGKKQIRSEEYKTLPCIYITHHVYAENEYTSYSLVEGGHRSHTAIRRCEEFSKKYIDREAGIILIERYDIQGIEKPPKSFEEVKKREIDWLNKRKSYLSAEDMEYSQYLDREISRWKEKKTARWFHE